MRGSPEWALCPQAWGPDTSMWAARAQGLCLGGPFQLLYFQRPPTLPLAPAPAFLLLQTGSKLVLSVRVSWTLAEAPPQPPADPRS